MTAGLAQRLINMEGLLPDKRIAILGSGGIGLIMARRLTLGGCEVTGIYGIMPNCYLLIALRETAEISADRWAGSA